MANELLGYQFGDYFLNLKDKVLYINNRQLVLSERMFLFLNELLKVSPELVSKEHLHKILWPDRQVSDWALARIVSDTRLLLERNSDTTKEFIKTARGIGYAITDAQAVYASAENKPTKPAKSYLWAGITLLILGFMAYQVNSFIKQQQLIEALTIIAKNQDYTNSSKFVI